MAKEQGIPDGKPGALVALQASTGGGIYTGPVATSGDLLTFQVVHNTSTATLGSLFIPVSVLIQPHDVVSFSVGSG